MKYICIAFGAGAAEAIESKKNTQSTGTSVRRISGAPVWKIAAIMTRACVDLQFVSL
jgi:hypothetical protein